MSEHTVQSHSSLLRDHRESTNVRRAGECPTGVGLHVRSQKCLWADNHSDDTKNKIINVFSVEVHALMDAWNAIVENKPFQSMPSKGHFSAQLFFIHLSSQVLIVCITSENSSLPRVKLFIEKTRLEYAAKMHGTRCALDVNVFLNSRFSTQNR